MAEYEHNLQGRPASQPTFRSILFWQDTAICIDLLENVSEMFSPHYRGDAA